MRSSRSFGGAAESITTRKGRRLIAAARHYLSEQLATPACRFDAVLIEHDGAPEWIKDALGE
jgi:putative endonuclease